MKLTQRKTKARVKKKKKGGEGILLTSLKFLGPVMPSDRHPKIAKDMSQQYFAICPKLL